MNRPSHYLLLFSLLFVGGYAALDRWAAPATPVADPPPAPQPEPRQPREPVSIKAPPSARAQTRHAIRGRVFDPRGFLVVGADIELASGERGRTDADGAFALDTAAPPPWEASIAAAGFRPQQRRLFPAGGDPLFLALEPAAPWDPPAASPPPALPGLVGDGFIRDGAGAPLANALVTVVGTELRACTDDIGHYRIALPGPGTELVVTHADRGLCCRSEALQLREAQTMVPLPDLVPEPGAAIRGTIRGPKGAPLEGVPLQLRGEGLVRSLESGRDGVFRIGGLLAGSYELVAMAFRGTFGQTQQVQVDAAVVDCDLQLANAEARRVRVIDTAGQPLPRAYVATTVGGRRREVARADEQGFVEVLAPSGAGYEVHGDDLRAMRVESDSADLLVVAAPPE